MTEQITTPDPEASGQNDGIDGKEKNSRYSRKKSDLKLEIYLFILYFW